MRDVKGIDIEEARKARIRSTRAIRDAQSSDAVRDEEEKPVSHRTTNDGGAQPKTLRSDKSGEALRQSERDKSSE